MRNMWIYFFKDEDRGEELHLLPVVTPSGQLPPIFLQGICCFAGLHISYSVLFKNWKDSSLYNQLKEGWERFNEGASENIEPHSPHLD